MNSLNRVIEKGEKVVLKRELFKPAYWDVKERTVVVNDGFGMLPNTAGSAIYVTFVSDGEQCRYEGFEIDKFETDLLHQQESLSKKQ